MAEKELSDVAMQRQNLMTKLRSAYAAYDSSLIYLLRHQPSDEKEIDDVVNGIRSILVDIASCISDIKKLEENEKELV